MTAFIILFDLLYTHDEITLAHIDYKFCEITLYQIYDNYSTFIKT